MRYLFMVIVFLLMGSCLAQTEAAQNPARLTSSSYRPGTVKHIVLFRYKPDLTSEERKIIRKRILSLAKLCQRSGRSYFSIEAGYQNSHEGVEHGFEEGFIISFKSEGDRNFYVGTPFITNSDFYDPEHQKFKEFIGPFLMEPIAEKGVLVFDFKDEK